MKNTVLVTVALLLGVLLLATGALSANDKNPQDIPARETLTNGPKDIPPGWERIVFIHYKKEPGKPEGTPGKKPAKKDADCYGFIGRGVKWKTLPIPYTIGSSNLDNVPSAFIEAAFTNAAQEWDSWTTEDLFYAPLMADKLTIDPEHYNGSNEIAFGDLSQINAIAVTIVWAYLGGPPSQREIIEFDMILDDNDYTWGDGEADGSVMDVQNIATHELGHALGLDDVYEDACSDVTMYGYSDFGDIIKRDLADPDVFGLWELYGE